jgi:aspartyl-tRNA(Asn)/glutamyl-tRNA(Gln) amidotransferase subunit A
MQGHDPITGEMPSAVEAAAAIRDGGYTASALLERCVAEIEAKNDGLNAFVHTDFDAARAAAAQVDAAVAAGDTTRLGPLAGVPFGVKDLEDCAGMPTSRGSLLYKGGPPVEEDSIHVARLRAAGAIPVGKTAAPEFGTIQYTYSKALGVTGNAWDPERTPGGSSGGSAAAVAAGMVPFATASDGGGSTRIPASFSGLVGMKPSYGRVPHPTADPSQTSVYGVEVVTVADAARHLDVTAGPDDIDKVTLPPPTGSYEEAIETLDVEGLRIGWSLDLGFAVVDPEVAELTRAAAEVVAAAAGSKLLDYDVDLPDPVATWLSAGVVTLWLDIDESQHYPDRLDDMTPAVANGLRASYDRPVRTLAKSLNRRLELERRVAAIYQDLDVLLTPATAVTAFPAKGPSPTTIAGEDMKERFGAAGPAMSVPFTMLANLCWNPACSVPAGLSSDGMPVGLQIQGRRHADDVVLRLARLFEQSQPWERHAPMGRSS